MPKNKSPSSSALIEELVSIRDWVRYAASEYRRARIDLHTGFASHLSDAQSLVCFAVDLDIDAFDGDLFLDARLATTERKRVAELIHTKITSKKPTAYITRQAHFADLLFYVDERVLVPRSPIAELIEGHFAPWVNYQSVHRVLDLCTGSGCIAIACAYAFEGVVVDAVDISTDAIEVAKINQAKHGLADHLTLYTGDLFAPLAGQTYDIIVSNPPYVDAHGMANLPDEIRHEPTIGLVAGADGLDVVHRILREAHTHLSDDGILVVEVGNARQSLADAYPQINFTWLEFAHGGHGVFLLTKAQLESITMSDYESNQ